MLVLHVDMQLQWMEGEREGERGGGGEVELVDRGSPRNLALHSTLVSESAEGIYTLEGDSSPNGAYTSDCSSWERGSHNVRFWYAILYSEYGES